MKDNVIAFPVDGDLYRELALKKAEGEDLSGALVLYRKAMQLQPNNPFVQLDLAEVYAQMRLYDRSIYHLFCALQSGNFSAVNDALPMLAEVCIFAGDYAAGSYYMQRVAEECDESEPLYSDEFLEYLQQVSEENPPFRLVYPPESVDYGVTIEEGRRLMKIGQHLEAIETLSKIPETSADYTEALCHLSLAHFLADDHERAEETALLALKREPDCVFALTDLVSVLCAGEKRAAAEPYLIKLRAVETQDPDTLLKLATAFCEAGEHHSAERVLSKLCTLTPYNLTALYLHAVAAYNTEQFEDAKRSLTAFHTLMPNNPVALYVWNLVKSREEGKKPRKGKIPTKLPYVFTMPPEGIAECAANALRFEKASPAKKKEIVADPEQRALTLSWVMFTEDDKLQREVIAMIAETKCRAAAEYLESLLIEPVVPLRLKQEIVYQMLLMGMRKKTWISVYNVLAKLPLRPLETEGDKTDFLKKAYAKAVSVLVVTEDVATLCDRLLAASENLYYYLQMSAKLDVLERYDESVLAAHLFTTGEFKSKHGARVLAKLFSADPEKIRNLWEEIL